MCRVRATGGCVCVSQHCGLLPAGEGLGALLGTVVLRSRPRNTDESGGLAGIANLAARFVGVGDTSGCVCVPQHCGLLPAGESLGALLGTVVLRSRHGTTDEVRECRMEAASSRPNMHGFTSTKTRQRRLNTLAWKRERRHSVRRARHAHPRPLESSQSKLSQPRGDSAARRALSPRCFVLARRNRGEMERMVSSRNVLTFP